MATSFNSSNVEDLPMPSTAEGGAAVEPRTRRDTGPAVMNAIAVFPGKPNTMHLREVARPSLGEVPDGRGVLVKVLKVGVDGTDKEINAAEYGAAPPGDDFLITGHESFGRVEAVGPNVTELAPGDYVVATVRRPGSSIYDRIGTYDMTTDDMYYERGINLRHGYLAEYYVDDPEYIVKIPPGLKNVAVLLEPTTVVEKGIAQAYEIQRRLRVWRPRRAAVMGAGTIGLLAAMALRLRGLEVTVFGRTAAPYLNSDLVQALGARYQSTVTTSIMDGAARYGPFDLIFEATGASAVVFESMLALGKNGVLVLSSVTGGDHTIEIPADRINLEFVLGNKVMVGTVNANREYFEIGVKDMAHAESMYSGWLERLLTHPVKGLGEYRLLLETLTTAKGAIKVYCEVAEG
jgi:threonine dehydrogenase-like Zn-dependent dehydrogenase